MVFDNTTTKTTLDGSTPKWATGDVIWLSDGTNNSTVTVQAADNGKTSFSFVKPAEITGATLYAVYPSTAAVGIASEKIQFTIPSEQDGKFSTANICVAKSTSTTLTFKNATAILKFGTIDSGIKHVVVPATNITGKYEVATPGDAPAVVTGQGNNTVTLSPSESVSAYYVAVAPVTISNKTDVRYEDVNWTIVGSNQTTSSKTLERSKIYNLGNLTANGIIPDGMLKYAFSVSATKKVHFSKGNLWTDPTATPTQTWSFESNQYDYTPSFGGTYVNTHVCHFFWETTGNYGSSATCVTDSGSDSDVVDWGVPYCTANSLPAGTWRTLSVAEWTYLLNDAPSGRGTGDTYFKAGVTVCGNTKCLVIAPDGNTTDIESSYDAASWATAESNGFVCLPAAGMSMYGNIVINASGGGYYWSSSAYNSNISFGLSIGTTVSASDTGNRTVRCSVRLVAE